MGNCLWCKKELDMTGTGGYRRKFCPNDGECRRLFRKEKQRLERIERLKPRPCEYCKSLFKPSNDGHRFCLDTCAKEAWREKNQRREDNLGVSRSDVSRGYCLKNNTHCDFYFSECFREDGHFKPKKGCNKGSKYKKGPYKTADQYVSLSGHGVINL